MSTTIDRPMNVLQARQLLRDTRSVPEDRVSEAERVVRAFYATKPRRQCFVCPSGIWTEHETKAGDDVCWGCARCHTSADLTRDEIRDQQAERHAEQQAAAEVAAAAQPAPRVILKQRLAALAEAQAAAEKLERAVPVARVWECQSRVEAAEQAAEEATATAAAGLAEALAEGKSVGPSSAGAKSRAALAEAVDAAVLAKNSRTILESRLTDAKLAVGYAADAARKAARTVIASERLEDLINDAIEARSNYLESVGQIGWLFRNHAVPDGDARPRQILSGANTPPSAWREAASAGDPAMEAMHAALMLDAAAVI
jgi:hypothetical protein